jgi:iron-sulfur cluster assembly protein
MINLTSRAIAELERLKKNQDTEANYLKIEINQGGCLEYFYQLGFSAESTSDDIQIKDESSFIIITNSQSQPQIENLTIDYLEDVMGGAFQFKNPNITHNCNCGISFSLDS